MREHDTPIQDRATRGHAPRLIRCQSIRQRPPDIGSPDKFFQRCSLRVMIEHRSPLIKTACMPRILKLEQVEIEMVTELVAQRAQEGSVGCNFLAHCCSHPQPDIQSAGVIVAKQFGCPVLADAQRSGSEYADSGRWHLVEFCCAGKELSTWSPDVGGFPRLHRGLDCTRDGSQKHVTRQVEGLVPVALVKARPVSISWWCVSEQVSLPQSVLEDLNPKTAIISQQAELHPPGNAGRIVVDRVRKAERPSIVVAVPLHQSIDLPLF
jgi:hypothetical protein